MDNIRPKREIYEMFLSVFGVFVKCFSKILDWNRFLFSIFILILNSTESERKRNVRVFCVCFCLCWAIKQVYSCCRGVLGSKNVCFSTDNKESNLMEPVLSDWSSGFVESVYTQKVRFFPTLFPQQQQEAAEFMQQKPLKKTKSSSSFCWF